MDVVIPVALGNSLTEKYILTVAELDRHRAKSVGWRPNCVRLDYWQVPPGIQIETSYWVKDVVFQRC